MDGKRHANQGKKYCEVAHLKSPGGIARLWEQRIATDYTKKPRIVSKIRPLSELSRPVAD
jgi:hypothetical protein